MIDEHGNEDGHEDDVVPSPDTEGRSGGEARVWGALGQVCDPEIPMLSVVELGLIAKVRMDGDEVIVEMTPSFAACPAISVLQTQIRRAVQDAGFDKVRVDIVFDPPWSTDRITPAGLEKLQIFGLAPPKRMNGRSVEIADVEQANCPYCGSGDTQMESSFGPTLCRAIHYCRACRQSFEHFKPVTN